MDKNILAACEKRAIELYQEAKPDTLAGECQDKLVAEFGEECVRQMLANGIGNNRAEDQPPAGQGDYNSPALWRLGYENVDGKLVEKKHLELFVWAPVHVETGEVEMDSIQIYSYEREDLAQGWEWRLFRLFEA